MSSISCLWSRLPYEIISLVLVNLDDASQRAVAATSRRNYAIVRDDPALVHRQKALRDDVFDQCGDVFVEALSRHRAALRNRRASLMLPPDTPPGLLLAVASLVAGSGQRPSVRYTPEQLARVGSVPANIDVVLNCAWRGIGETIGSQAWPAGVQGIELQANGIAWSIGKLQLPEGVKHVNLARNAIGDGCKLLRLPDSVRCVDLSDNWINGDDRAALRARYSKVHFTF